MKSIGTAKYLSFLSLYNDLQNLCNDNTDLWDFPFLCPNQESPPLHPAHATVFRARSDSFPASIPPLSGQKANASTDIDSDDSTDNQKSHRVNFLMSMLHKPRSKKRAQSIKPRTVSDSEWGQLNSEKKGHSFKNTAREQNASEKKDTQSYNVNFMLLTTHSPFVISEGNN